MRRYITLNNNILYQLSLGELISQLSSIDMSDNPGIKFNFGKMVPWCLSSWRGAYHELAIEPLELQQWLRMPINKGKDSYKRLAKDFLEGLKSAVGKTFEGYKGGEYVMFEEAPLWVANWGEATHCAVVGVSKSRNDDEDYNHIIIHTWYMLYD